METGLYLPNGNADIVLRVMEARDRRDTCSHCYLTVDLYKTGTKEVVAASSLISIALLFVPYREKNETLSTQ